MKYLYRLLVALFIMFSFNACSTKPTHIELVINSSNDLNPDINKVSSPLMLSFYELESAENFMKYDYWTLVEDSGKNLNRDLISQTKHIIVPNQQQTYKIRFDKDARFLGVVANFREIQNDSSWKQVINLDEDGYNFSELKLEKFSIERVE
ncbi:type VI secretion system lipoprotein TssJ [Halarcobacter anaerophilus]|uniref:Type VI secretion system lipoprotein TssJ n=1 Tax=Halarcobacter anaerophilus TaxID=877500 RepID=A0A4Q0XUQ5_9BACT|nr:type VI secretion system lipoprotein TssJ [Halarcobacter anaerophilus]QDF28485.1 type VI secretion system, membrane platform protein [Halarcobacter anaerophilus]RXJ61290.1 type VI secretion system lipoprotein TssJ [Halarcobacter anaerophilus]